MLVAADMKWKKLASKYGVDELIQFGFRWPTMLAADFKGQHLSCLTASQMQHLGVNATRALECRPHISHIAKLHMSAAELKQQGWNIALLQSIGLDMKSMVDFGYSLQEWINSFEIQDLTALGFTSRAMCEKAGWHLHDINVAFASTKAKPTSQPMCIKPNNATFTIQL